MVPLTLRVNAIRIGCHFSYKSSKMYIDVECSLLPKGFPQYDWDSNRIICSEKRPWILCCRSYKNLIESDWRDDVAYALFHIIDIFDCAFRTVISSYIHLIKTSIFLKSFPCTMKCAELSPLFKTDDYLLGDNYRNVNGMRVIFKIHKTLMNDQLSDRFLTIFTKLLCAFHKKNTAVSHNDLNDKWV